MELGKRFPKDQEGVNLAILIVEDIWYPDKLFEAEKVFGTTNSEHPGVKYSQINLKMFMLVEK